MPFSSPSPTPLNRLYVYDGLMMNAKRWQVMESYHRRRQNLQYQSLHQPGIVCGLGVRVIDPPASVEARFKDDRWLEIQPGMAIDQEGNPIIVASASPSNGSNKDHSLKFRVNSTPSLGRTLTVYIVVSYSEPTAPPHQTSEVIREWFRFDQLTHPPNGQQVELCRIQLQEPIALKNPQAVLFPRLNELDFRHRQQAHVRPQAVIRVAQLKPSVTFNESSDLPTIALYQKSAENLAELIRGMAVLSPTFRGDLDIQQVTPKTEHLSQWDLLYIPDGTILRQWTQPELEVLKQYVQQGGGILVETAPEDTEQDVTAIKQWIRQFTSTEYEIPLLSWEELAHDHPLRRSPFLFGTLPEMQPKPMQIYTCGGVVLIEGRLSSAWGLGERQLPRGDIRTAQELGINILHFLWQQRHFMSLLEASTLTEQGSV